MRPAAPATVHEAAVVGAERVGSYVLVRLEGARGAVDGPGRFAMALDPDGRALLPRPVGPFPTADGGVALLVDPAFPVGALARARRVQLLGPLGRGFALAGAEPASTVLVSGGVGLTVFPGVPAVLGGRPRLLAGFRDGAQAAAAELVDAERVVVSAPALVTEPLERTLDESDVRLVLVAGPRGLAAAVARLCAARGIACQAALEAPMACGFGACHGCVVPLGGRLARLCVEGPVVDGGLLLDG